MATVIDGWSGKSNGLEIASERYLRFLELKEIGIGNLVDFMWSETTPHHFTSNQNTGESYPIHCDLLLDCLIGYKKLIL